MIMKGFSKIEQVRGDITRHRSDDWSAKAQFNLTEDWLKAWKR